jgi:hypothetical protein
MDLNDYIILTIVLIMGIGLGSLINLNNANTTFQELSSNYKCFVYYTSNHTYKEIEKINLANATICRL